MGAFSGCDIHTPGQNFPQEAIKIGYSIKRGWFITMGNYDTDKNGFDCFIDITSK